jgi:hypothetical protein
LQQARYADLVVLSQSDPTDDASKLLRGLPESITLNSGRPVLLVPYAGEFSNIGQRALVAWGWQPRRHPRRYRCTAIAAP